MSLQGAKLPRLIDKLEAQAEKVREESEKKDEEKLLEVKKVTSKKK